jgi:hypothetical protein
VAPNASRASPYLPARSSSPACTLTVSELEVTEPGLYLDELPENGDAFAGLVATLVR